MTSVESLPSEGRILSLAESAPALFLFVTGISAITYWLAASVFPDIAYGYFRVALHMAETGAPIFNAGDRFNPVVSPLWLVVLATLGKVGGAAALPLFAKCAFIACLLSATSLLFSLLRGRTPLLAAFVAVPVFFSSVTLVGGDTAMALVVGLAMTRSFVLKDRWLPLWVALFYLARPEGAVLGGLLVVVALFRAQRAGHFRAALRSYRNAALIGLVLAGAWHVYEFARIGAFMQTGDATRIAQGRGGWRLFVAALKDHLAPAFTTGVPYQQNVWTVFLSGIGAVVVGRSCWPLLAWPVIHLLVFTVLGAATESSLYYPIEFAAALYFFAGIAAPLAWLCAQAPPRGREASVLAAAAVLIGAAFLMPATRGAFAIASAQDSAPTEKLSAVSEMAAKAHALAPGKAFSVLAEEPGLVGYLLPEARVYDLGGVAAPLKEPSGPDDWSRVLAAYPADFVLRPPVDGEPLLTIGPNDQGASRVLERVAGSSGGPAYALYAARTSGPVAILDADAKNVGALIKGADAVSVPLSLVVEDGRLAVFAHAPSLLVVAVPAGADAVEIGYGYRNAALAAPNKPDGALFKLSEHGAAPFFSRRLDPVAVAPDRGLQTQVIALPRAGPFELVFEIDPGATPSSDWTYWLAPRFRVGENWVAAETASSVEVACPRETPGPILSSAVQAGVVDELQFKDGRIAARGWAADVAAKRAVSQVIVLVGDKVAACVKPALPRPDVAQAQGAPGLGTSGFAVDVDAPGWGVRRDNVRLIARLHDGRYAALPTP